MLLCYYVMHYYVEQSIMYYVLVSIINMYYVCKYNYVFAPKINAKKTMIISRMIGYWHSLIVHEQNID